jgi:predicted nicotinamide N-methyase
MPPRVRYQTLEFEDVDIHVRALRDNQEYSDDDGEAEKLGISSAQWSLFGVLWASGEALARHLFDYNIEGLRILEVGCGLGLASLVLNHRHADITATDYHPEAGASCWRTPASTTTRTSRSCARAGRTW